MIQNAPSAKPSGKKLECAVISKYVSLMPVVEFREFNEIFGSLKSNAAEFFHCDLTTIAGFAVCEVSGKEVRTISSSLDGTPVCCQALMKDDSIWSYCNPLDEILRPQGNCKYFASALFRSVPYPLFRAVTPAELLLDGNLLGKDMCCAFATSELMLARPPSLPNNLASGDDFMSGPFCGHNAAVTGRNPAAIGMSWMSGHPKENDGETPIVHAEGWPTSEAEMEARENQLLASLTDEIKNSVRGRTKDKVIMVWKPQEGDQPSARIASKNTIRSGTTAHSLEIKEFQRKYCYDVSGFGLAILHDASGIDGILHHALVSFSDTSAASPPCLSDEKCLIVGCKRNVSPSSLGRTNSWTACSCTVFAA